MTDGAHHDPDIEAVAIATAGMLLTLAAHDRARHYTPDACPLPLAEMDVATLDPAALDFMALTLDPVRHALMAGLRRLGHEGLRLGGPRAVAELRGRLLAEAAGEAERWRGLLDVAWRAV